ncbi:hypothetical protein C241_04642 [Bradyrhizobium lupini HPC(L)]|uniref:Uncharacterized protein n=1 Tax=Bradyrhizobium lupini HPC(L) TaxID=1229491 RepID=A0ABN0HQ89_RHILU|nr:hypothetical protein C241_04642 [Bradyrhizobium lupini HPC(L)]
MEHILYPRVRNGAGFIKRHQVYLARDSETIEPAPRGCKARTINQQKNRDISRQGQKQVTDGGKR